MTSQLKDKLVERGYKALDIKNQINSLQYNDNNKLIKQTILSNWHLITSYTALSQLFTTRPMVANKKNQSLANKLVRAKIKTPETITDPSLQPKKHRLDPPPNIQTHLPNLFPRAYPMVKCKNSKCKSVLSSDSQKQFTTNYAKWI